MVKHGILTFFLFLFLLSCGVSEEFEEISINQGQSAALLDTYFKSMSNFKAEVIYEEGAEPYSGHRLNGKPRWNIFINNVSSLLKTEQRGITPDIPKTLSEMKRLSSQSKNTWTAEEIYDLIEKEKSVSNTSDQGVLHIAFLNGNFKQGDKVESSVLGVHLTNTTVIAIFKDKIKEIEQSQGSTVALFVEQSVLVHEFGHAMGLVNNGVPLRSQHHDAEHGAHCTARSCVMYYLNEGASDLQQYVRDYIISGDEDLFGPNCLQDAARY